MQFDLIKGLLYLTHVVMKVIWFEKCWKSDAEITLSLMLLIISDMFILSPILDYLY